MPKVPLCRELRSWNGLWLLLFILGMGVFFMGMPKYNDDYWYMWHLRDWFDSQGVVFPENGGNLFRAGIPWRGIWDTWVEHYATDNLRLGNLLAPLLLIFPKWVGSGLMTIMGGSVVVMSFRFAGVDIRRSPLVIFAIFVWSLMLPWRDHLGVLVYQLNYIFPAWLTLSLSWVIFRRKGVGTRPVVVSGVFLLGVLTGMSHELNGAPAAAALCMVILLNKEYRTRVSVVALAGLCGGLLILMCSPGMSGRVSGVSSSIDRSQWYYMFNIKDSMPFAILVVTAVVAAFKGYIKDVVKNPVMQFFGVNVLCSLVLIYLCFFPGRIWFWLSVTALITAMYILRHMRFECFVKYTCLSKYAGAVLLALVAVHLVSVDVEALRCRGISKRQIMKYVENPEKDLFGEVKTLGEMPVVCLYMPDQEFYAKCMLYVRSYYSFGERRRVFDEIMIPECLERMSSTSGVGVGSGIRKFCGYYVGPESILQKRDEYGFAVVPIPIGERIVNVRSRITDFTSLADGRRYVWIDPAVDWMTAHYSDL